MNGLQKTFDYVSKIASMSRLMWQARPLYFVALMFLSVFRGLPLLASAWLTKLLFDLLAQSLQTGVSTSTFQRVFFIIIAQAIISILSQMSELLNEYLTSELGRNLTLNVQSLIYRKINSFVGLKYLENPKFYDTINLATQGAYSGPLQIIQVFSSFLQNITMLGGYLWILLSFSPLLAGAVGLISLLELYIQLQISRQQIDLAVQNSPKGRRASYYSFVLSGLSFAKELRLFNLVEYFLRIFLKTTREIHDAQRNQQLREMRGKFIIYTTSSLISTGAFATVVLNAFAGRLTLGDITLYLNAVENTQNGLSSITYTISTLNESILFYTYFTELLALSQPALPTHIKHAVPKLRSGIELRDVSFRYTENHPWVLRHVNLHIPAGKCLAIVGLNGAGKTTLVKLLTRLYDPTEGQILWDGIDISEFDPEELRHHIGTIFQDFLHYELTAQENIGFGDIRKVDDLIAVQKVAKVVGIHNVIDSLPNGYQTILSRYMTDGQRGAELSGGEWQKVALARMLMRDADLLILDEPTASLDAQAEYELHQHFVELMSGHTSILISHRLSTVRMADVIAVLDDGHIKEYGSHEDLASVQGIYAKLYDMQAERYR